ncbi:MAG: glutathione S-transferase, partial [Alphaproteobacteria bacterium]|nr:glutathione S-transferase [Alphaproteobacteria bacterium]
RLGHFMADLDTRLGESKYVAGDNYSVADITALVVVDFAGWVKVVPQEDQTNLKRWYDEVNARPSAKA